MDLCNYQAKSHRDCMQISESDHCDSDLTENQSHYNTPHHKISRFSILISIGTWENRGQTDAPPVTGAHAVGEGPQTLIVHTVWFHHVDDVELVFPAFAHV